MLLLQLKRLLLGEQAKMLLGPDKEWATGKPAAVRLPSAWPECSTCTSSAPTVSSWRRQLILLGSEIEEL